MSLRSSFNRFPDLPLELRLTIWEYALSGWTVLASGYHCAAPQDAEATYFQKPMIQIGPAPYLVGLACAESRRLLEQSHTKVTFRQRRESSVSGVYWVNMNRTAICLDVFPPPVDVLGMFDIEALLVLQHVVMRWNVGWPIGPVARACQFLATLSPALRTIVIQTTEDTKDRTIRDESWFIQSMSAATATYYSTLPDYEGPEMAFDGLDSAYLRPYLQGYSVYKGLKLHILPPISNVGSA